MGWKHSFCVLFIPFLICVSSPGIRCQLDSADDSKILTSEEIEGNLNDSNRNFRNFIIVSTIDGKITALNPYDGKIIWSIGTDPGNLLSSSLSKLEAQHHGQWIRLVPSLDGNLYKFDGRRIEPLPVTAESLLKSSYKIGDNLIIIGGKETRSYGVNLQTGELRYLCTVEGCKQFAEVSNTEDVLVIERHTQTVRAVHSRTGADQWNFSVGEHRITVSKGLERDFPSASINESSYINKEKLLLTANEDSDGIDSFSAVVKVVMPEGFIAAVDRSTELFTWSHKLSSPIVNVWQLGEESVFSLDLFSPEASDSFYDGRGASLPPALLLMGVYDKKLYIKQSSKMKNEVLAAMQSFLTPKAISTVAYQLEALPEAPGRTAFFDPSTEDVDQNSHALMLKEDFDSFERGFYFYQKSLDVDNNSQCSFSLSNDEVGIESFEKLINSIWYYWREVLVISAVLSGLLNGFCYVCLKLYRKNNPIQGCATESENKNGSTSSIRSDEDENQCTTEQQVTVVTNYVSRYLTDFEPLECLGKGGFGVVFEAKNKIDECSYAIKRIKLKNREDAFEKVMREVKALAKLDHSGIVRYFNAWVESPPLGWQESKDKEWDDILKVSSSYPSVSLSETTQQTKETNIQNPFNPFGDEYSTSCSFENIAFKRQCLNTNSNDSIEILFQQPEKGSDDFLKQSLSSSEANKSSPYSIGDSMCFEVDYSESVGNSNQNEEDIDSHSLKYFGAVKSNEDTRHTLSGKKFSDGCYSTMYLYIQMQLCRKESLKDWLSCNTEERNRSEVLDIFHQIVNAVQYVHECGLMHRDLKPSNIFFSLDGSVKIGDFGLVTAVTNGQMSEESKHNSNIGEESLLRHTDQVGTQLYMSPEQISRLAYNHKVDIFSLGLIFFELLVPFTTQSERVKVLTDIRKQNFPISFRKNNQEECEFATKLLSHKPEERPPAAEIKTHPLFKAFQMVPVSHKKQRTVSQCQSSSGSDCDTST